ncbi:DUF6491 family protein [Phenylobacterium sp. SCN 70-31]|uniref:DUF6491 family protein n=1 Tax=Phenylobacterium sp. SCN 70-31 TaxID=1660129 RepID=UPI000868E227|nr:DUF6491 family protein [Phenylobacterium sp. SCN 70-31]ODT89440.1 MAG: hypothetical protein ABS78_04475 [Phenylobacterium sp. SCN 70-31]
MTIRTALAIAAVSLAAAAAAPLAVARSPDEPAAAKPARQCFWTRQVNNFASEDGRTVNVRVGVKDVYQFQLMGPCGDVEWNTKIAIRSRGGSQICSGLDAEIISPTSIGPQTCPVTNVRKLTDAEIAALPKRAKP